MPKNRTRTDTAAPADRGVGTASTTEPSIDAVREIADALCRAAHECYQQHGRSARIGSKTSVDGEAQGLERLCAVCDDSLARLVAQYEKVAANVRPGPGDEDWWHRANALWHASREFVRRHQSCDSQTRHLAAHHSSSELESLHLEFELEASALLALKQSCDGYCRLRPQAL